jgi:hypothetical protein
MACITQTLRGPGYRCFGFEASAHWPSSGLIFFVKGEHWSSFPGKEARAKAALCATVKVARPFLRPCFRRRGGRGGRRNKIWGYVHMESAHLLKKGRVSHKRMYGVCCKRINTKECRCDDNSAKRRTSSTGDPVDFCRTAGR